MTTEAGVNPEALDGQATCHCGAISGGCLCLMRQALDQVPWEQFTLATTPAGMSRSAALQGMPPPHAVETMVAALKLKGDERVLQIGTGTGYTAAVLSNMVQEVYSIERFEGLVDFASRRFQELDLDNLLVRAGNGQAGWAEEAPFDAILVSATAFQEPPRLLAQLTIGGRLVMPVGSHKELQTLVRFTRTASDQFVREALSEVRLVTKIGDILIELGAVSRDEVERAAKASKTSHRILGDELSTTTRLDESDLYRALAIQRGLRFGTVDTLLESADPEACRHVPRAFLEHNQLIPLGMTAKRRMRVATCNPSASPEILSTAFPGCRSTLLYLVTPTDYRRLWRLFDLRSEKKHIDRIHKPEVVRDDDILNKTEVDAHFIALLDAMLLEAVAERASDIHLERYGERVRVRLRVDGVLRDLPRYNLSPAELVGLVNVIKIKADMDISERRRPQGGRIKMKAGDAFYDLRVQTQPALHGEHVVIRLLPQDTQLLTIEGLGFEKEIADDYRRLLFSPAGLILVVGPTGSGKSTTLYAGLQVLGRDATRKVLTVEDPIEYSIEDVQQSQVKPSIGFTFANAMRAFVREDPDVILVGEIRDGETALEAIRASQTGHVVLSTLHSNDSVDAVQRLFDLGMHPNSIASELLAVIAQRLAKRICEGCRIPATPDPAILSELFPDGAPADFRCYEGRGCRRCSQHGTHGRVAALEYMRVGPGVRSAITRQLPLDELRRAALESGLRTMRENVLALVQSGTIPLSEVPRILPVERMAPEVPLRGGVRILRG